MIIHGGLTVTPTQAAASASVVLMLFEKCFPKLFEEAKDSWFGGLLTDSELKDEFAAYARAMKRCSTRVAYRALMPERQSRLPLQLVDSESCDAAWHLTSCLVWLVDANSPKMATSFKAFVDARLGHEWWTRRHTLEVAKLTNKERAASTLRAHRSNVLRAAEALQALEKALEQQAERLF